MTAIWDRLGGTAYRLAWEPDKWNEKKAQKVMDCMRAVYMCIKDRAEYQDLFLFATLDGKKTMLLDVFKITLEMPHPTRHVMATLADIASTLHDFDHMDTPTEFGASYGHHTEVVIGRKRANKPYREILKNIHFDYWWDE